MLLAYGADPESKDGHYGSNGEHSALGLTTWLGRLDIVRLLIDERAVAWKMACGTSSTLHIACMRGWVGIVESLLEVEEKLNDKDGEECVCGAAAHMRVKVVELLVRRGVKQSGIR